MKLHPSGRPYDLSDLRPELIGLEGQRIEATDRHGERRRFYVGKSTGWKPVHLEIKRIDSSGGDADWGPYTDIRVIHGKRRY
jgi:hypothetical protein